MLNENFIIAVVILNLIGGFTYLIPTLRGAIKPNRVTWFIWALAPMIAFVAEIKQGVGLQSLMTFMVGFVPLIIFLASFVNKNAYWKIGRLDIACGALALVGIGLWGITRVGNLAILFSILADGLGAVPTVVKSYHAPETESYLVYLLAAISAVITLLTITAWNFEHYAFPAYILLIDLILLSLIKFKLGTLFAGRYA